MKWEPIEKYDKLKKKVPAVFLFEETKSGRMPLPRMIRTDRQAGNRLCIAYCKIPSRFDYPSLSE